MIDRKPAFLRGLRIKKVSLVERGANEEAEVVFFKSIEGGTEPDTEKGRTMTTASRDEVFGMIESEAGVLRNTQPTLTYEQAIAKVYDLRPDLVRLYRNAEYAPAPVQKDAGTIVEDDETEIVRKIDALASRFAREAGVGISKGYDLVDMNSEGQRLMAEYKALQNDPVSEVWKSASMWPKGG